MSVPRTRAIAGIALCGQTIVGDISEVTLPTISSSDVKAVARIASADGWFVYLCPIVSGEIVLNQPYSGDDANIAVVHSGEIEAGDTISIQIGKGMKHVVFSGTILDENRRTFISKGRILSEFHCIHNMDELAHRYTTEDISYSGNVKDVINLFLDECHMDIDNECTNIIDQIGGGSDSLKFKKYDLSLLEILHRITAEYCYVYLDGDKLKITDVSDMIRLNINKNSKITDYKFDRSQTNQYRRCIVQGVEGLDIAIAEDITTKSNKELYIEDNSILTNWDALTRAKRELKTANETQESIELTLSDIIYPEFGKVKINLPGINIILELKSIRYTISRDGVFTTIYLGRSYKSWKSIFRTMKK